MKHPLLPIVMLVAAGLGAGAGAAPADPPGSGDVVAFRSSVRVDVDAQGKPLKVEAADYLPEAIRDIVERRVASWQYEPATIGGVPQAATTYVMVNACAVPIAEGYRLGVDFDGNGPRIVGDRGIPPPVYPRRALVRGLEASFKVIFDIDGDGRATIDEIEDMEVAGRGAGNAFGQALQDWAGMLRFDPEIVAGNPVTTRLLIPVDFVIQNRPTPPPTREEWQAKAKASRECQLASGAGAMRPVALQPAVTVTPKPAG